MNTMYQGVCVLELPLSVAYSYFLLIYHQEIIIQNLSITKNDGDLEHYIVSDINILNKIS